MTQEITHRFKYTVPSYGSLIENEADFDDPQDGLDAMHKAFEDGFVHDWEYWIVTKTVIEELMDEQHREEASE